MKKYVLQLVMLLSASIAVQRGYARPGALMAQIMNPQRPEDTRSAQQYQADCAAGIALTSCAPVPVSTNCPADRHWSLKGTAIAHCVLNDISCPPGQAPERDAQDNPVCTPISCPAGMTISGNQCVFITPPTPTPPPPPPPLHETTLPPLGFHGLVFGGYSYSGNSLSALNIPAGNAWAKMNLVLNTGDGRWTISSTYPINPNGCCQPITTPGSGIWTTNPSAAYQYRISAMVYGPLNAYLVGYPYRESDGASYWNHLITTPAAPTDWINLPANSLIAVAGINMDLVNGCSYVSFTNIPLDVRFTLQVRALANPSAISTTVFDLVFRTTKSTSCSSEG